MTRQRGAAMLALIAVLFAVMAAAAVAALRPMARQHSAVVAQQRALALARDALRGAALVRRCTDTTRPLDTLIPCPEGAIEGTAAASCAGTTRGWLPWRTLGIAPQHDASGTCLWIERDGLTARVIAPGAPAAAQARTPDPSRVVCPGNADPAQYLDAGDVSVTLQLDPAQLAAVCP
jgi:hypothetical protein